MLLIGPTDRPRQRHDENSQFHLLPYGTGSQQATQDYALEASFLRIITTPAIPRLSNNQEDDSGTGWKVMLSRNPRSAP